MKTKFTPGLESLDRRDVPSAVTGDLPCGNEIEVRFPNRGGCWPGPQPSLAENAIIIINSLPDSDRDASGINNTPTPDASAKGIIVIGGVSTDEFAEVPQKVVTGR